MIAQAPFPPAPFPPPPFAGQWLSGVPVGVVCPYAGQLSSPFEEGSGELDSNQPALWLEQWGWLFCDGRELDIALYPMLYTAIGDLYGGGETTFRLPDYRGLFFRCVDDGAGIDPDAADREPPGGGQLPGVGSRQGDTLQNHQHVYQLAQSGGTASEGSPVLAKTSPSGTGNPILPDSCTKQKPDGTAARTSTETRPKNIYVNYIIKCW